MNRWQWQFCLCLLDQFVPVGVHKIELYNQIQGTGIMILENSTANGERIKEASELEICFQLPTWRQIRHQTGPSWFVGCLVALLKVCWSLAWPTDKLLPLLLIKRQTLTPYCLCKKGRLSSKANTSRKSDRSRIFWRKLNIHASHETKKTRVEYMRRMYFAFLWKLLAA